MWKKILIIVVVLIVLFVIFRNIDFSEPVLGDLAQNEIDIDNPIDVSGDIDLTASGLNDGASEIDTEKSMLTWFGENKIQNKSHGGTLDFSSSSRIKVVEDGSGNPIVEAGYIVVDMTSLEGNEGEPQGMIDHLRSEDFFNVDSYQKAQFSITETDGQMMTGDLTIKGRSDEVTFPYSLEKVGSQYKMTGEISFDRTKWNINTLSGSIFDDIGDAVIEDTIVLTFVLFTK